MGIITEDMDVSTAFYTCWGVMVLKADVSDFEDGEIRCISPLNPPIITEVETWDGILKVKQPVQMDLGMNKNREVFCFVNDKWEPINAKTNLK